MEPINRICSILRRQVVENQMRVGQVIDIVLRDYVTKDGTDPYFVSDEKFAKCLEQYQNDMD